MQETGLLPKLIEDMIYHPLRVNKKYRKAYDKLYDYLNTLDISSDERKKRIRSQTTLVKMAELILLGMKCQTVGTKKNKDIYFYDGEIWQENAETHIESIVHSLCPRFTMHQIREIIDKIGRMTPTSREIFNPERYLGLKNGVWDFELEILKECSPDYYLTRKTNFDHDPDATCPAVHHYLDTCEISPNDKDTLFEYLGWGFRSNFIYQKALILAGPTSTGKSKFCQLTTIFFGKENVSDINLRQLNQRFNPAELVGKFFNVSPDESNKMIYNITNFKRITGEDSIMVERKYKDPFSFTNTAKLLHTANEMPSVPQKIMAEWARWWLVIEFTRQFKVDRDETLLANITIPEELSGLFNEFLAGLKRLEARGHFEETIDWQKNEQKIRQWSDPVKAFIDEFGIIKPDKKQRVHTAYRLFEQYLEERGKAPVILATFSKKVRQWTQNEVTIRETKRKINGKKKKIKYYHGIYFQFVPKIDTLDTLAD
jgi:P4 family phage/plasmid primase-like protien